MGGDGQTGEWTGAARVGGEREHRDSDEYVTEVRQVEALNRMSARDAAAPPPRDAADRAHARAADVLTTGHALARAESPQEALALVSRLADASLPLRTQVVLRLDGGALQDTAQFGLRTRGGDHGLRVPLGTHHPAAQVARTGEAVFLGSPDEYRTRFPAAWQRSDWEGLRAWAYLPLTTHGELTGVWGAAFATTLEMTEGMRTLLAAVGRLLGQSMQRAHTGEAELALAQSLRTSMGRVGPGVGGLSVAARYVPTGGGLTVGGDWYDSLHLPDGRLALVIGDVQGHDAHAAGLMSQLRTAIRAYAAEGHGPDAVLVRASHFLAALDGDRFATCVYLEADPATGVLRIARAGHPHPVLRLPDGTCLLKHLRGGLPLGLTLGEDDYPVNVLTLQEGEILMLCTDGLIETGGHDMYSGWLRVRGALTPGTPDDLEGLADRLLGAVVGPQAPAHLGHLASRTDDDIALLLLRRDARGPRPALPERHLLLTLEQDQAQGLAEARTELQGLLHDWARSEQVDTAVLLASELLGNVLVHTEQAAVLRADVGGAPGHRRLRVEVTDRSDEIPHQRAPGELSSSGRGLVLLDLLAHRWNVRPEPVGKTVWFELDEDGPAEA
ncbi:SpoIIE family protein phosphatase [Streptomyces sp. NPDC048182]|uniref:SpoIIE family protein phosphatase n=1 Tax=Streptomyces sp. NPDC048182 TaxID=3365507 RepID=UPI0037174D71